MKGILADINVAKQRRAILAIWSSDTWRDLWNDLRLSIVSFPTLGLSYDSPDDFLAMVRERRETKNREALTHMDRVPGCLFRGFRRFRG